MTDAVSTRSPYILVDDRNGEKLGLQADLDIVYSPEGDALPIGLIFIRRLTNPEVLSVLRRNMARLLP